MNGNRESVASQKLALINIDRELVLEICSKHGATDIAVFGSVIRGEASPKSDLDLLVTFEGSTTLFDWIGLEEELGKTLGRKVDVVSRHGLSKYIGPVILKEAQPL